MLTRTLPSPQTSSLPITTPEQIEKTVDERGFYLYEWISSDELRMTGERDYLNIVKVASIPLAIITVIAGFIGFSGGIFGVLFAVFWVLSVFYIFVFLGLFIVFLRRSYLYTRSANVVITDDHYVSWGEILQKSDTTKVGNFFEKIGNTFDEQFLENSQLAEKKEHAKTALFDNLKDIALGWGKILQNVGRSRDSWGIVIVVLIAGALYGMMMGAVYFIGIFFITFFGRAFSWVAHLVLLATSNTEYTIQNLFSTLDTKAKKLQATSDSTLTLLDEAGRNEWKENLLGKIDESITLLSDLAGTSTEQSVKLRKILESSKYKDIFNFTKYGHWVKIQILEPIESILLLLSKNHATLEKTIEDLTNQINETTDLSLQGPLILQKDRLELQQESFTKNIELLKQYQEKLQ